MPIFLVFTILFALYLNHKIRKSSKNRKEKEDFLQREAEANFTRKADIQFLPYLNIPFASLPFSTQIPEKNTPYIFSPALSDETRKELVAYETQLLALKEKKILNLTAFTNTDLKLKYGIANLTLLMQYDENFAKLSRILAKWGRLLFDVNEFTAAKQVLEYAVSCRCDIEDIFITLAKLYHCANDNAALEKLEHSLDCFDELRKASVAKKIKSVSEA